MVEVIIAGYPIDAEVIKICKEAVGIANTDDSIHGTEAVIKLLNQLRPDMFTPEVISAAYARISRDPRDIPALRAETRANVEAAKRSNRQILFGQGHKAVADGFVFNMDILGISRRAVEEVEARRIGCGYIEKSQRYITLDGDYVIPQEYSMQDAARYVELVENAQNKFYHDNLQTLIEYQKKKNPDLVRQAEELTAQGKSDKMNGLKNMYEGWAKEDNRYALCMGTKAQIGFSPNARALEHEIRINRYHPLLEVQETSEKMFEPVKDVSPSLIALSHPEIFMHEFGRELIETNYKETRKNLRKLAKETFENEWNSRVKTPKFKRDKFVKLIEETDIDTNIIASILFTNSTNTIEDCYGLATKLKKDSRKGTEFVKGALKYISEFDAVPREFEVNGGLIYDATISASCFAQLKRHRIMTLLSQDYMPELGITIPDSIKAAGLGVKLAGVCDQSTGLYKEFKQKYGLAADYCLTNAHRRHSMFAPNIRELYHISRMREDGHAQWDIRYMTNSVVRLIKKKAPLTSILMCGKDKFKELREEVYGK